MAAGRNRNFDKDVALESAMHNFWEKGYAGTSLSDLTKAMGLNKSSLYATFTSKEVLFNESIALYLKKHGRVHSEELFNNKLVLKQRIRNFLLSSAKMITDSDTPIGCFICQSTSELNGENLPDNSAAIISDINKQSIATLALFFEQEQEKGNLSSEQSSTEIANYLMTLQFGLAVSARNGSSYQELESIVDFSLNSFSYD